MLSNLMGHGPGFGYLPEVEAPNAPVAPNKPGQRGAGPIDPLTFQQLMQEQEKIAEMMYLAQLGGGTSLMNPDQRGQYMEQQPQFGGPYGHPAGMFGGGR